MCWLAGLEALCHSPFAMEPAKKPVVVIAGQTPPPTGGQNVMIARLLEDLRGDGRWRVEHLEFRFTPSFATVRKARFSKVLELLKVYGRLARLAIRYGRVDFVIYPSGGPQTVPVVRDIMLLPFVRLATKQLWVQFHAAGIADRLNLKSGVLEMLIKAVYRSVDGAIVMTDYNRCDPEALGIGRVEIIAHRLEDENRDGKLPNYSARPLRILHAGHLYDLKGTPQLVAAFGSLAPLYPDWNLVLMGEFLSPYSEEKCRARCRELGIEDRVEIAGVLRGERKAAEFRKSHLFVFASVAPYESFGLVMAEAMMWGLPMVVSNWRGNRDVAGAVAEYFEVGLEAESSLAERLRILLERPTALRSMAENSRKRYISEFRQDSSDDNFVSRLIAASSKA
jgi:glycosyltransferase involved in cell wall biosynthesis